MLYVFRTLVGKPIPLNEGCLKPLTIIVPEGTAVKPVAPAAVIAGIPRSASRPATRCTAPWGSWLWRKAR